MKIGFAGTPHFAASILTEMVTSGFTPTLVLTQPDRPQGRGMKLTPSPVKSVALAHHIPVFQPPTLKTEAARAELPPTSLDVLVVAAYGLILPAAVLNAPKYGCINVHASLLPRWRGAAPIHRAILSGDTETGVTIMKMDEGLDTGDMIASETVPIAANDTTATLHDKLAALGGRLMVAELQKLAKAGSLPAVKQPDDGVTYAHKIERAEALIDWNADAAAIERAVRAFNPFPVAFTLYEGEPLKIWAATAQENDGATGAPGQVLAADDSGITVKCGRGTLTLTDIQRPGGKKMPVSAFLKGHCLKPATVFGS